MTIGSIFRGLLVAAAGAAALTAPVSAQLRVVTSTTDLYDIATQVGGDRIEARHIGEGYQDPHFIEAKPSFILQLRNADVWAYVGLDLEIGWMPLLLQGARNSKINAGGSGDFNASKYIEVLDAATGRVDRSQGDVHALGNPHYWLDPENGRLIARAFRDRFTQLDPGNAATYAANEKAFEAKLDQAEQAWQPALAKLKGRPVVAWHTSWRYLAQYAELDIVAFMEPKPGVPPSASHVAAVIATVKRTGAKAIIMEPFYDRKMADFVADRTDAEVVILAPSVGGMKGLDDYISVLRNAITQLANAL
ncbi:MAG: metal ABC transporter substrate-binding protein [Gemmatimonadota bacterium]